MRERCDEANVPSATFAEFDKRHKSKWYDQFLSYFVRRLTGAKKFDDEAPKTLLSNFVTISDEAFALLTFENQEERWSDMYEKKQTKTDKKAKYTDGGNGKNLPEKGANRKGMGWTAEGWKRFNVLYDAIEIERMNDNDRREFESDFRRTKMEEKNRKNAKKHVRKVYDDDMERPTGVRDDMEKFPFFETAVDCEVDLDDDDKASIGVQEGLVEPTDGAGMHLARPVESDIYGRRRGNGSSCSVGWRVQCFLLQKK